MAVIGFQAVIGCVGIEAIGDVGIRIQADRLELAGQAVGLDRRIAVLLQVTWVKATPVAELGQVVEFRFFVDILVGINPETQLAVVVDLVDRVKFGLLDPIALLRESLAAVARGDRANVLSAGRRTARIQGDVLIRRPQGTIGRRVGGDIGLGDADGRGRAAVRITALRQRTGNGQVARDGPVVGRMPLELQATRLDFTVDSTHLVFVTLVLAGRDRVGGRNDAVDRRVAVKRDRGKRMVEPVRQFGPSFLLLRFGIEGVGRDRQVIGRLPLHNNVSVSALGIELGITQAAVARGGNELSRVGRGIGDLGRRGNEASPVHARLRRGRRDEGRRTIRYRAAARIGHDRPVVHRVFTVRTGLFLIRTEGGDAKIAAVIGPLVGARDFRRNRLLRQNRAETRIVVGQGLDREAGLRAGMGQRLQRLDVDRSADAARIDVGAAGLVDLNGLDAVRGDLAEVKGARIALGKVGPLTAADNADRGGRHDAAVDGDGVVARTEATDRDLFAFTADAVDRNTRDALQRVGQVGVGILADVFRRNAVDDAVGVLLDVHRTLQRATDTRNNDNRRIVIGGRSRRSGRRRGLRHGRTGQGNDSQCGHTTENRVAQQALRVRAGYFHTHLISSQRDPAIN